MQVVSKRTLKQFWEENADAEVPLRTWHAIATKAEWETPQNVKDQCFTTIHFGSPTCVVFDIGANKFRLIVRIAYKFKAVQIKFVGTHKQYDKIDPETV